MSLSELGRTAHPYLVELPHVHAPYAYVLDYDRTLGDTAAAMDRFYDAAAPFGIDKAVVEEAKSAVENDGGSFSPLALARARLAPIPGAYEQFRQNFIGGSRSLLYPDTRPLLGDLQSDPVTPHLVLTAGADLAWQALKLAGSGYTGHAEIVPMRLNEAGIPKADPKGPVLAQWLGQSGTFSFVAMQDEAPVAVYTAEKAVLVDDKADALGGLPEGAQGVLIRRPSEKLLASQKGELPEGAIVISSLAELQINRPLVPADAPLGITKFIPLG